MGRNLEKRKLYIKSYYQKNKKELKRKQKEWVKNNPEKWLAQRRRWTYRPNGMVVCLRNRLKRKNKELYFTNNEFVEWYSKQKEECHYCGITKNKFVGKWKNFSIDRKDNNKSYFLDNIVLACFRCNTIKNNFFSENEMREIAQRYITPKLKATK